MRQFDVDERQKPPSNIYRVRKMNTRRRQKRTATFTLRLYSHVNVDVKATSVMLAFTSIVYSKDAMFWAMIML